MRPDEQILRILKKDSPATVRHICAILHPSSSWEQVQPNPAGQIRRRCNHLAHKGSIWNLGQDTYSESSSTSIDEKILSVLRREPLDLHGVVLALWPTLDERPRDVALTAIHYIRFRVDALITSGTIKNTDGKLLPTDGVITPSEKMPS